MAEQLSVAVKKKKKIAFLNTIATQRFANNEFQEVVALHKWQNFFSSYKNKKKKCFYSLVKMKRQ